MKRVNLIRVDKKKRKKKKKILKQKYAINGLDPK